VPTIISYKQKFDAAWEAYRDMENPEMDETDVALDFLHGQQIYFVYRARHFGASVYVVQQARFEICVPGVITACSGLYQKSNIVGKYQYIIYLKTKNTKIVT
jgi:hypothetical protein